MTNEEMSNERFAQIFAQESREPLEWYWLSFCDPHKPEGEQFLGVCIVCAHGPMSAVKTTHHLKINPGGEVRIYTIGNQDPGEFKNKLLNKAGVALLNEFRLKKFGGEG